MRTEDLFHHTIKKVNGKFGVVPVKGEIRYSNGVFILNFVFNNYVLRFVTDRGYLDVYVLYEEKSQGIMAKYPEIADKTTTPKNIEFIIDFLHKNRNEIFVDG